MPIRLSPGTISGIATFVLLQAIAARADAQAMTLGGFLGFASAVGDVTGDGRADYATQQSLSGVITWQVRDGTTGALVSYLATPWATLDRFFGVGDVNGDGQDDVCWFQNAMQQSTIRSGADGSTLLSLASSTVEGGADIDGDGLGDLLVTTIGPGGSADTWIRSSRTGTSLFSYLWSTSSGLVSNHWVVLGDENGDGFDDAGIASSSYSGGASLGLLVHGPDGSQTALGLMGGEPCGDVDGDGATDVLANFNAGFNPFPYVLAGGSHATIWSLAPGQTIHGVGDVDGDGHVDLAVITVSPASTAVYSGATHLPLAGVLTAQPIPLGDLDGDGRVECTVNGFRCEWVDPAAPIASRMLRRGHGGTTSSGRKPTIVTRGHCGLGHTIWFDLRGNEPNSLVAFAFGDAVDIDLASLGAPGNRSYTTVVDAIPLLADAHGVVTRSVVMPVAPALLGVGTSVQAATFDPAANALGLVTSNAIDLERWN